LVVSLSLSGSLSSCTGATDEQLPPDVADPAATHTPSGAVARYRGALALLPGTADSLLTLTGILTDELAALPTAVGVSRGYTALDSRQPSTSFDGLYAQLHHLRGEAQEARGFLRAYAPDSSAALAGHLYALEGWAELSLADVFCSGIPLSTVNFSGDYTLAAGSTTQAVYEHAIRLLDSAVALSADSGLRLQPFAAVVRGRALLALGRYAEAAAAVAGVLDAYTYQVTYTPANFHLLQSFAANYPTVTGTPSAANGEGGTGLDYRTSGDPRTPSTALGSDQLGNTMYFPDKYPTSGAVTLTLASGIEARLIEAEAALQANPEDGQWLARLNALRTDGTFEVDTQVVAVDETVTPPDTTFAYDTLWHAGSGGVAGLDTLADPGTADGRLDLLFRERAFWLYLTGHRQGDLRRLVREYLRDPEMVYPTGTYPGGPGTYGSAMVAPVPEAEHTLNTKYTGCFNADA
jgi:tetratricopeptide (TPR) repeat protein